MKKKMKFNFNCLVVITLLVMLGIIQPLHAESLTKEAQDALLRGNWIEVLAVLERTDIKDADVPCRMVAAHACLATNRNNDALILFLSVTTRDDLHTWNEWTQGLAEKHPENPISRYLYADALVRTSDISQAEEEFARAIEQEPKLALGWIGLGIVKALQGKKDEAYMDLVKATQLQPSLADAHASLGCMEVMLQNAEGAIKAFDEALRIDPNFALAYNGRGCARYGLGKPDEAFLDFEMAQTLFPALVMTEANRSFVLDMVARKVDEKIPPLQRPGTTLTQTLVIDIPGIWTQGADRPDKWGPALIGSGGYERFNLRHEEVKGLKDEPGHTILLPKNASPEVLEQRLQPVFDALQQGKSIYVKVDMNIGGLRYFSPDINFGFIQSGPEELRWAGGIADTIAAGARAGKPDMRIFGNMHSAGTVVPLEHMNLKPFNGLVLESSRFGAQVINNVAQNNPHLRILVSPGDVDLPHGGRGLLSINQPNVAVANLTFPDSIRLPTEVQTPTLISKLLGKVGDITPPVWPFRAHSNVHDPTLLGVRQVKVGSDNIQLHEGTLGDIARNYLQTGSIPFARADRSAQLSSVAGLTFPGTQPWSQMPNLLDGVVRSKNPSGPALLVTQDPVKSYGFQRMLENKGIPTVVVAPMDMERINRLGSAVKPSTVVGFQRDLDDSYRKLVPFLKPPDDFGGVGIGTADRFTRQGDMFSFPGADGKTITLPIPSGLNLPNGTWNSFKPWKSTGNVGGVRTEDLEWVFVDKGDWPVLTSFGLLYQINTLAEEEGE